MIVGGGDVYKVSKKEKIWVWDAWVCFAFADDKCGPDRTAIFQTLSLFSRKYNV